MQLGICCSTSQRPTAAALAARLERNLGISTLAVEAHDEPVCAVWDQATGANAVLILLDAKGAPGPVRRDDWATLLEHVEDPPVAIWRVEPCQYPRLLERRPFLATADPLEAGRWIERRIIRMLPPHAGLDIAFAAEPVPGSWWEQLVDQPGVCKAPAGSSAASAQTFAHHAAPHFQGVLWIPCENRPLKTVAYEIEFRIRTATRLLIVLAGWPADAALPSRLTGRHSWLIVPPAARDEEAKIHPLGTCQALGFPAALATKLMPDEPEETWTDSVEAIDKARRWLRATEQWAPSPAGRMAHLSSLNELYRRWRLSPDEASEAVAEVPAALAFGWQAQPRMAADLCWNYSKCLLDRGRNQEAVFWLRQLAEQARQCGDAEVEAQAQNELIWLVDEWGALQPAVTGVGEQLSLPLEPPSSG